MPSFGGIVIIMPLRLLTSVRTTTATSGTRIELRDLAAEPAPDRRRGEFWGVPADHQADATRPAARPFLTNATRCDESRR